MWENITEHINGHRVAKTIYGTIIILVVIVVMEDHPPSIGATFATIVFTGLGVALAEWYSDFIGKTIEEHHILNTKERRRIVKDVSAVMTGAWLPMPFVILAWMNVIDLDLALDLAKWTMVGVLLFYGYIASRLSGHNHMRSFFFAVGASLIGIFIVMFKQSVGH
jgi:hypothetical protein